MKNTDTYLTCNTYLFEKIYKIFVNNFKSYDFEKLLENTNKNRSPKIQINNIFDFKDWRFEAFPEYVFHIDNIMLPTYIRIEQNTDEGDVLLEITITHKQEYFNGPQTQFFTTNEKMGKLPPEIHNEIIRYITYGRVIKYENKED